MPLKLNYNVYDSKIHYRDGKTQLCVRFHNGTIRVVASA